MILTSENLLSINEPIHDEHPRQLKILPLTLSDFNKTTQAFPIG